MPIIHAPAPIDFKQLADCPISEMWLLKLKQVNEQTIYRLNPHHNLRFSPWVAKQSNIIDLTRIYNESGTRLWKSIIDILIDGVIYPIENGYVFALDRNSTRVGFENEIKTHIVFVNSLDGRLAHIHIMRHLMVDPIMQQLHRLQMPIPYEELMAYANLTAIDLSKEPSHPDAVILNRENPYDPSI